MKVKELFKICSPFIKLHIFDAQTMECLTCMDYLTDSNNELYDYSEKEVYKIVPKVNKDNRCYLAVLVNFDVDI